MMLAALTYPSWLRPEIIPGLPFRWYGFMYVVAFGVSWLLFNYESKRRGAAWSDDDAAGSFFWAIVGLLVGARLFGTLVYDPSGYYWTKPWLIFWPFDGEGRFAGFQGMSYHGGLVGVIVATLIFWKVKKKSWLEWADVLAVSAPLGYTAGRLGNFINGELWGKVASSPIGMIFPNVPDSGRFPAREAWVQELAAKAGIELASMNDIVNLPRHPSQLYEACFEGIFLWLLLWFLVRKRKAFPGLATGLYVMGYGAIRFFIEYFREPDAGIGYVIGDKTAPIYLYSGLGNISTGQVFCALMLLGGALIIVCSRALAKRKPSLLARAADARPETKRSPSEARKIRKKIR
jgi:phosphatidylglycerol:prolipoprotein diacylglycerol transferase